MVVNCSQSKFTGKSFSSLMSRHIPTHKVKTNKALYKHRVTLNYKYSALPQIDRIHEGIREEKGQCSCLLSL